MSPTFWGAPDQSGNQSWMSQYGPWLAIGLLVLIGIATSGEVTREKKKARR